MNKMLKYLIRIFTIIIGVVLLTVVSINIYFRTKYENFYSLSEREFKIPGLDDGYIPQGITCCNDGTFLTCGYMKDGSASRIYIVGGDSYVTLKNSDGTEDTNHAGGLAVYADYLYMTNGDYISIYLLEDVLDSSCGNEISPVCLFYTGLKSAFVYIKNDKLYVGEFYRDENYLTEESHHMSTDSGDMHHAVMAVFELSEDLEYGFTSGNPEYVYSITDLAQGVCITDSGDICLSTSYGTASSYIYVYEDPEKYINDGIFDIAGDEIPLYYLDSKHLQEKVILFPMAEELYFADNRIYIMCESASNKYFFGKFTGCNYVYSIKV